MAAIKMGTGRLMVVHKPICEHSGLPVRYALMDMDDIGFEWLLARDVLHSHYVCVSDDIDLPLAIAIR